MGSGDDEAEPSHSPCAPGVALYGSASVLLGATSWMLEFKRYRWAHEMGPVGGATYLAYTRPPTLELEDQLTEDGSFTVGSDEVTGWHLRFATSARDGTMINANLAQFYEDDPDPIQRDREVVTHGYGGFERYFGSGSHLIATVGYRRDVPVPVEDNPGDFKDQDLVHGDLSATVVLGKGHALEGRTRVQWFTNRSGEGFSWVTATANLSWAFRGKYFLTALLAATSDPSSQSLLLGGAPGNLSHHTANGDGDSERSLYGAIEAIARPAEWIQLKALAGATKGGIVCSGGQCRVLPGFEGFRFETLVSF